MPGPKLDERTPNGVDLGRFARPVPEPRFHVADLVGIAVSLVWLALVGGFFLFGRKKKAPARRGPPSMVLDAE